MTKKEISKKTSELIISVDADKKQWKEEQKKAKEDIFKNISIKGFRKGKVPVAVAEKNVTNQQIFSKAIKPMLDVLIKIAAKEIDDKVIILDSAAYAIDEIDKDKLTVKFIYPIYPEIKLSNYKELKVKYKEEKYTDEDAEKELEKLIQSQTMLKPKEGKIEKGDVVTLDFEGFVDDKPFEGGKSENYELEIGKGEFVPGFEEAMIGLENGAKRDIQVTFPKDYHSDELKGKDAIFKVLIKDVKIKEQPELNDEFAKSIGAKDVETIDELKKYIKKVYKEQNRQQARSQFQKEAVEKILEKTEIVIPATILMKEIKSIQQNFEEQLKKQNMSMEQYMKMTGIDRELIRSQFKEQAEIRLNTSFIFAEIAKKEKIEIKDEDYEKEYKKLAKIYNQSEESIKGLITKSQMQIPMTNDRVLDIMIKNHK